MKKVVTKKMRKEMEDMSAPGNMPPNSFRAEYPMDYTDMNYNYPENVEVMYRKEMEGRRQVKRYMADENF